MLTQDSLPIMKTKWHKTCNRNYAIDSVSRPTWDFVMSGRGVNWTASAGALAQIFLSAWGLNWNLHSSFPVHYEVDYFYGLNQPWHFYNYFSCFAVGIFSHLQ